MLLAQQPQRRKPPQRLLEEPLERFAVAKQRRRPPGRAHGGNPQDRLASLLALANTLICKPIAL